MPTSTQYLIQANSVSANFRKEIRKRDINARFAQRRQQLLQQQRASFSDPNHNNSHIYMSTEHYANLKQNHENLSEIQIKWKNFQQKVGNIEHQFLEKNIIQIEWIYLLAKATCQLEGAKIVSKMGYTFFIDMYQEFIATEKYDQSKEQQLALLVINNILTIAEPGQSSTQTPPTVSQVLHILCMEGPMLRLQCLVNISQQANTKLNALGIIFSIIYTSEASYLINLINCPQFLIMNFFQNLLLSSPSHLLLIQALRCYYILVKRLNFQEHERLGKLRKLLNACIRNTQHFELLLISIICFQSMLKSLPSQRQNSNNKQILPIILQKTLAINNSTLTIRTLKLASYLLHKNKDDEHLILCFLQKNLEAVNSSEIQALILKMLYDILLNSSQNLSQTLSKYPRIFEILHEMFYSNLTQISVSVQVSICIAFLTIKIKGMKNFEIERIQKRIQQIMNKTQMSQNDLECLERALSMIEDVYCFGQF